MKYYKPTIATFLILISIFAFSFSSCEKVKDLAGFDINYSNPDLRFSLDSTVYQPKAEMLLYQEVININIDSIINAHELDGIENANFESVTLRIESPATDRANFNWLTSARITVSGQDAYESEVASTTSVPPNVRTIEMKINQSEISSIIKKGNFTIRIYGNVAPPLPVLSLELLLKSDIKMRVVPL